MTVLSVLLMVGSGLGAFWGYQTLSAAGLQNPGQLQSYLSCDGPGNKTDCNVHVPLAVSLKLQVNVTDHGKLLSSTTLPHDLILNNFYDWLIAALDNAQSATTVFTSGMKNTAGVTENLPVWGAGLCNTSPYCLSYVGAGNGGLIEVGSLSTAATRSDTALGTAFQSYFDVSSVCSTGSTDSVVVTGSENANSGVTMSESGLFAQNAGFTFMLAHDIFAGVAVSAGNTITVQYTWSLNNAGFNYNLCEYLAALFSQPNGPSGTIKTISSLMVFYDTSGRNVTWVPACNQPSYAAIFAGALASSNPTSSVCTAIGTGTSTNNAMQINIGTGTTAFTPTTRSLTSKYASNYITNTNYDSAGNAYETANILLATGATISEAAIYLTLPQGCIGYSPNHGGSGGACITSYGTDTIMLLGTTFTGVAVPNGQSIGITFQESG